ncbi:hypothetical protein D3C87_1627200 [compost metagenome]
MAESIGAFLMVMLVRGCNDGNATFAAGELSHFTRCFGPGIEVICTQKRISFAVRRPRVKQHDRNPALHRFVDRRRQQLGIHR